MLEVAHTGLIQMAGITLLGVNLRLKRSLLCGSLEAERPSKLGGTVQGTAHDPL